MAAVRVVAMSGCSSRAGLGHPSPQPGAPEADAQPPLSLAGAAERLGVSIDTLERMVRRNEIQTVTVGTRTQGAGGGD